MPISSKFLVTALAVVASCSAHAANYHGQLPTGVPLLAGDFIYSGEYCVLQQHDSNLVVYKRPSSTSCDGGTVIWASYSAGATKTFMQSDGNLVQYDDANNPKWSSGTGGRAPGNYRVGISQSTGSVGVVLWNAENTYGTVIWSTPSDPSPTPPTTPTTPTTPPNPCPDGGSLALYTVCVSPGKLSQYTYRFPACTQLKAQFYALQNTWDWGPCKF